MPARKLHQAIVVTAAGALTLLGPAGCVRALGREFAAGAAEGARPGAVGLLQQLSDTATGRMTRAYDEALRPRAESTLSGLLDTVHVHMARMEREGATFVEGPLSRALQALIARNLAVARDSGREAVGALVAQFARGGRAELPSVGASFASATVTGAVTALDAGLRGPLRQTLLALVVELADSVRSATRRTAEEPAVKSLFRQLGLVGGLAVGAVVLGGVGLIWLLTRSLRTSKRALLAVTTAVRETGTPEIRRAVKVKASSARVEGWLHDYLSKQGLLHEGPDRAS